MMKIFTLDERCLPAMRMVKAYCMKHPEWKDDIEGGKTFGVLLYEGEGVPFPDFHPEEKMPLGLAFLAAFSGLLDGKTRQEGFVPPIFDIEHKGSYFREEEAKISEINRRLDSPQVTAREVCDLRHERKLRSQALQRWLHQQYRVLSWQGECQTLLGIFSPHTPPGGTGDCCAPKLLQEAFRRGLRPIAVAEWNMATGEFCPPCVQRCRPLLSYMLRGMDAEQDPRLVAYQRLARQLETMSEDEWLVVVNKPSGLLSVPGKDFLPSVESITAGLQVHRLDQDTSGVMVVAKDVHTQSCLRQQFEMRTVEKRYEALLQHPMPVGEIGEIDLPLRPDVEHRPLQVVDSRKGKSARTLYEVLNNREGHAHVLFTPLTGRTHQLRLHAAQGLKNPILGDRLYGIATGSRMMLHASMLSFEHPGTGERMTFTCTPAW